MGGGVRRALAADHGSLIHILPLYDPEAFFPRLRAPVFDHTPAEFDELITATIVGELYEFLGKIRNGLASGKTSYLPALAVEMAQYGAYIIGLANRTLYTSSSTLFAESLSLPDRPQGYDGLCRLVMSGQLADSDRVGAAADAFWDGIEAWAKGRGLEIHTRLEDLLK